MTPDNYLVPLLHFASLRSRFSTWQPSPPFPCSTWDALACFLVFIGQLGTTSDVGKRLGSFPSALDGVPHPLDAQHCAGGAITRFPRVTTLGRAHYAVGHIKRPASHIKCAIAHRHRDLHAWRMIMIAKSRFLMAALLQRARQPISTTMCCFYAHPNSQTTPSVDGSGHHHTAQAQSPEVCTFSPIQVTTGIQSTIEHCRLLFCTST